jgi:DNA-binding transcriptional LysR family regulator
MTICKLAETRRTLAASPSYLASHGTPKTIRELEQHKFLLYSYMNNPKELHLTRNDLTQVVKVRSLLEANDAAILRKAAVAGLGILIQPTYSIYDDVKAGRLIPLLHEWELPKLSINIAYQTRKHLPAKVRVFIDYIMKHFHEHFHEMDNGHECTALNMMQS